MPPDSSKTPDRQRAPLPLRPDESPGFAAEVLLPPLGLALLSVVPIMVFALFVQLRFASSVRIGGPGPWIPAHGEGDERQVRLEVSGLTFNLER